MDHPQVAAVRRGFDAWNAGDVDTFVAMFHPECTIDSYLAQGAAPYVGHAGVRRWESDIREAFGHFEVEVQGIESLQNAFLVLGHVRLTGQASGVPLVQPAGFLVSLRDDAIHRLRGFGSHEEAREAAESA